MNGFTSQLSRSVKSALPELQKILSEQRIRNILGLVSIASLAFLLYLYTRDNLPVSDRDSDVTKVDIKLSKKDAEGQFERLADELSLSERQLEEVRSEIMAIIEEQTVGEDIDEENKEAMANIMASTIRQELDQLGHDIDPKAIGKQ